MKKLAITLLALAMTAGASAQREVGTTTVYPKIGINMSKINDSYYTIDGDEFTVEEVKGKFKVGMTAGVEVAHQLKQNYGISLGLLYSLQGVRYDSGIPSTTFHYLNVPMLLNGYLGYGFTVKAGVQGGYLLSAKNPQTSAFKRFDFSIPVGLSYEINNIAIDLRYSFGLTKTYKALDDRTCNQCIALTIGYGFDI